MPRKFFKIYFHRGWKDFKTFRFKNYNPLAVAGVLLHMSYPPLKGGETVYINHYRVRNDSKSKKQEVCP